MTFSPLPPVPPFKPIPGDDLPFESAFLRDVPPGYGFDHLTVDASRCPSLSKDLERLKEFAARYYADWEIVSRTYAAFRDELQTELDMHADTLEKTFAVYDSDIAKPILGRSETVVYDNLKDEGSRSDFDNPAFIEDSHGAISPASTTKSSNVRTGSVRTELSDLGVRPNYESLNGFIDNDRTKEMLFTDIFKNHFMIIERWSID